MIVFKSLLTYYERYQVFNLLKDISLPNLVAVLPLSKIGPLDNLGHTYDDLKEELPSQTDATYSTNP